MNKKIVSLILTVIFVFAALPAFCEGTTETVETGSTTAVEETTVTPVVEATAPIVATAPAPVTAISTTKKTNALATVNYVKAVDITQTDVDDLVNLYIQNGYDMSSVPADDILASLIQQELLLQAYEKEGFVDSEGNLTENSVNGVLNYYVYLLEQSGYSFATEEEFNKFVEDNKINLQDVVMYYASTYLQNLYLDTFYADALKDYKEPTDEEIKQFYADNKDAFDNSEKLQISHIFFQVAEGDDKATVKAKADEVYSQIKNGSLTFEKAVKTYSEDSNTKENAGLLGWLNYSETDFEQTVGYLKEYYSDYHKKLFGEATMDAIFKLDDGQISEVLESTQGYHIFKCVKRQEAKKLGLNEVIFPDSTYTVYEYLKYYMYNMNAQVAEQNAINLMFTDLASKATITINKK